MSRTRRLLVGAVSTVLGKGAVFLASIASVPIMVRYLGPERFGIWMTISTVVTTLLVLDLGVASALVNFISEAYATNDRDHASTYSTTALATVSAVALLLGLVAHTAWPYIHWATLFHLSSPNEIPLVSHAWAAAVAVFLVGMPAGLAIKILGGYQELRSANIFAAAGSLGSLCVIVVLVKLHAGFVTLVASSFAALVAANMLCLGWLWFFHKPWLMPRASHFNRSAAKQMVTAGGGFFVLQLSALLAFNSDNLVVTHYLGPAQVTSYSVAWRLAGFASIAQSVIAPAVWPAYAEAFARGDLPWVRQTFRRILWTTMLVALTFAMLFAFVGRSIIRFWASPAAVPTETLMLLMCVWVLISTLMSNTSIILTGKGDTRLWAATSLLSAVLNLTLSIYWVQHIGAVGVVLGTIVSYLFVLVVPQTWQCYRILRGT